MVHDVYRQDRNADGERAEQRDECLHLAGQRRGTGGSGLPSPTLSASMGQPVEPKAITVDVCAEWCALPTRCECLFLTRARRPCAPKAPNLALREERMRDSKATEYAGSASATSSYAMAIAPDTPAAFVIHDMEIFVPPQARKMITSPYSSSRYDRLVLPREL